MRSRRGSALSSICLSSCMAMTIAEWTESNIAGPYSRLGSCQPCQNRIGRSSGRQCLLTVTFSSHALLDVESRVRPTATISSSDIQTRLIPSAKRHPPTIPISSSSPDASPDPLPFTVIMPGSQSRGSATRSASSSGTGSSRNQQQALTKARSGPNR